MKGYHALQMNHYRAPLLRRTDHITASCFVDTLPSFVIQFKYLTFLSRKYDKSGMSVYNCSREWTEAVAFKGMGDDRRQH